MEAKIVGWRSEKEIKQGQRDKDLTKFDGSKDTWLAKVMNLAFTNKSKFLKLNMTWPAQNRKAGRALNEKYRKDGHLRQTCENRHFHTLKRQNEDF